MDARSAHAHALKPIVLAMIVTLLAGLAAAAFAQSSAQAPLLAVVSPAREGPCTITDQYKRGDYVIFRIQVIDPSSGNQLTAKDVSGVDIVLPDGTSLKAKYGTHEDSTQEFWVAKWRVPANYPTGQVDFKVEVQGSSRAVKRVQFAVPDKMAHLAIVDND
ncbi:MAG: hypothetical protein P8Y13_11330 [Deinococcales bacterium]|jgi:hypothetical protein